MGKNFKKYFRLYSPLKNDSLFKEIRSIALSHTLSLKKRYLSQPNNTFNKLITKVKIINKSQDPDSVKHYFKSSLLNEEILSNSDNSKSNIIYVNHSPELYWTDANFWSLIS